MLLPPSRSSDKPGSEREVPSSAIARPTPSSPRAKRAETWRMARSAAALSPSKSISCSTCGCLWEVVTLGGDATDCRQHCPRRRWRHGGGKAEHGVVVGPSPVLLCEGTCGQRNSCGPDARRIAPLLDPQMVDGLPHTPARGTSARRDQRPKPCTPPPSPPSWPLPLPPPPTRSREKTRRRARGDGLEPPLPTATAEAPSQARRGKPPEGPGAAAAAAASDAAREAASETDARGTPASPPPSRPPSSRGNSITCEGPGGGGGRGGSVGSEVSRERRVSVVQALAGDLSLGV